MSGNVELSYSEAEHSAPQEVPEPGPSGSTQEAPEAAVAPEVISPKKSKKSKKSLEKPSSESIETEPQSKHTEGEPIDVRDTSEVAEKKHTDVSPGKQTKHTHRRDKSTGECSENATEATKKKKRSTDEETPRKHRKDKSMCEDSRDAPEAAGKKWPHMPLDDKEHPDWYYKMLNAGLFPYRKHPSRFMIVNRLFQLPVVKCTSYAYRQAKKNAVLAVPISFMEIGVCLVAMPCLVAVYPFRNACRRSISAADRVLCKGLDAMEKLCPCMKPAKVTFSTKTHVRLAKS